VAPASRRGDPPGEPDRASGVGKTRLAIAAAARKAFPDAVWLVPLALLHDPDHAVATAEQALGVPKIPHLSAPERFPHPRLP
jgi:non-specific serine/threonine protein kinase